MLRASARINPTVCSAAAMMLPRVDHQDAAAGGVLHVDVVDADSRAPDHPEAGASVQDGGRYPGLGAHDQGIELPDHLDQLRLFLLEPDLHLGTLTQPGEAVVGELVADQHLGGAARRPRRIWCAHAAHLPRQLLRSSVTH
jgi:hypothetical protein